MATDSDAKLTKYKSAVTVVTADFANSIFGGLYGSADGDSLSDDDPRVLGHVHDGVRADGHAPKVHLVKHVTDQLTNPNLADDAVMKRNVWDTINQDKAIPEFRVDGTKTYYYLDLRAIRNDFVFQEDQDPAGDGSQNKNIRQRYTEFDGESYVEIPGIWNGHSGYDFVFGSSSLEDLNLTHDEGESRFQFDKSNSSFRAGSASSNQWDEANRGAYSVGFGSDNRATGDYSATLGGLYNEANSSHSVVSGGFNNKADAERSVVAGGESNEVGPLAKNSVVSGGAENKVWEENSVVSGGGANKIYSQASVVSGGINNEVSTNSHYSSISGGFDNYILGEYSSISGGFDNHVESKYSHISGGQENRTRSDNTVVLGGFKNTIDIGSQNSVILGGDQCAIAENSSFNLVYGLKNEAGTLANPANYSSILGGESNIVESDHSAISGGKGNYIGKSSELSYISGGELNTLSGTGNSIVQGSNSNIEGVYSTILGGVSSNIIGDYNIIAGPGEPGASLNIGIGFKSKTGRDIEDSPSYVSGIFGGESSNIVGGNKYLGIFPSNNYILGSPYSNIGATFEDLHVTGCSILGSSSSEISAQPIDRPTVHRLLYSNIVGGYDNFILMGNQPDITEIFCSGIIGGFRNGINIRRDGRPNTPWYQGSPHEDVQSEYGVQTSYILGGSQNLITNSEGAVFERNSLLSTIIGGNKNIISSSYASTILGGGMFPDVRSGQEQPPYADTQYYHSNVISSAHSSTILNGSSNYIATIKFPFDGAGVKWNSAGKGFGPFPLPEPAFCIAEGRESCSYLYGQKAYSTGGHHRDKFESQGFLSGAVEHTMPSQTGEFYFKTILGGLFDTDTGEPKEVPGSAQTSTVNFYGSFDYKASEIQEPSSGLFRWLPLVNTWFEFRAHLDGSRDTAFSPSPNLGAIPSRCFIPRYIGSYSFTIKGQLRYTDILTGTPPGGPDEIGHNHMVSFTYNGYVIFQPDGSGFYGGELKDVICSDASHPVVLDLMDPLNPLNFGTDFYLAFCPEWDLASGAPTDYNTAYNISKGRGSWPTPNFGLSYGPKSWPPHFSIYVINNTGNKGTTGAGHGTSRELIGESIVAKAEITEDLLFLGKYDRVT